MPNDEDRTRFRPEEFRNYLLLLARLWLPRRLQRRMDASDLVQVAHTKAIEKAEQFRGENRAQYRAWLREILKNTLRDGLRKYGRAPEESVLAFEASASRLENRLTDSAPRPSQRAMLQENLETLAHLLEELPPDQQEVLVLKHCLGWKIADIAEELGRTTASVAGLLRRGLQHLRGKFTEQ